MYADDLILFASSIKSAEKLLGDVAVRFKQAGLAVNPEKCAYMYKPGRRPCHKRSVDSDTVSLDGVEVARKTEIIFLGSLISLRHDSRNAWHHRQAVGNSCFHKWGPVLRSRKLPLRRRIELFLAGPFLAATWHSETWILNKDLCESVMTWVRRKIGHIIGIHVRGNMEVDVTNWWRSVDRAGKVGLHLAGKNPIKELMCKHWDFASHLARLDCPHVAPLLRKMSSYRWEFVKTLPPVGHPSHHVGPFHINRWDQHLFNIFKLQAEKLRVIYQNPDGSEDMNAMKQVGWSLQALDTTNWKNLMKTKLPEMMNNLHLDFDDDLLTVINDLHKLHEEGYMCDVTDSKIVNCADIPESMLPIEHDETADLDHLSFDSSASSEESQLEEEAAEALEVNNDPRQTIFPYINQAPDVDTAPVPVDLTEHEQGSTTAPPSRTNAWPFNLSRALLDCVLVLHDSDSE